MKKIGYAGFADLKKNEEKVNIVEYYEIQLKHDICTVRNIGKC